MPTTKNSFCSREDTQVVGMSEDKNYLYGFKDSHVVLEVPQSGDIRKLLRGLTYTSEKFKIRIYIPEGFETDLGSIPQLLQGIFPKDGKAMFAYILHDYLYYTGMYSQWECDSMLDEAMGTLGVSYWRRKAVRSGLAVGGWYAYNQHRKRNKK
jgi:hypothetical protein